MTGRPLRYDPTPEDHGWELRNRLHGERTLEELQEAQKRTLEGLTPLVHPLVWREALRAADGDPRRIAVFSPTEVYVLNEPGVLPRWLTDDDLDAPND